jgi:hypothetical protein
MLEEAENIVSASNSKANDARRRMPHIFDKVNGLIELVKQQQLEISELKNVLAMVSKALFTARDACLGKQEHETCVLVCCLHASQNKASDMIICSFYALRTKRPQRT